MLKSFTYYRKRIAYELENCTQREKKHALNVAVYEAVGNKLSSMMQDFPPITLS